VDEGASETATLTLASGTGYMVGTPGSQNMTIADDDTQQNYLIDLELLPVVTPTADTDGTPDTITALPGGIASLPVGSTFYLEAWMKDVGIPAAGISGGYLDIAYNTSLVNATGLSHGSIYTVLSSGIVNDAGGLIDEFGGSYLPAGSERPGIGEWVLLGRVTVVCTGVGTVTFTPQESDDEFSRFDAGAAAWGQIDKASVEVQQLPASPDARLILLDSPTAGLTTTTLPEQAELHIVEDHGFYGEVWVRSNPGNPANIGGGAVNLSFNPAYGRIVSVESVNANWTSGNDGTVDNTTGTLTGLTRADTTPSAGDDEWVLFARVQFSGKAPVAEAAHTFGPYDLGLGMTLAEFNVSGGTYAANDAGSDDAQVYSVIYDVDDSGRILGGDFGVFSAAYRTTVGGAEPPYSAWADFDGSGKVLGGDFGMFSGVYRKYTYEIDFSQLPARYRPAGWTSGASVRVLTGGGSGAAEGFGAATESVVVVVEPQQPFEAPVQVSAGSGEQAQELMPVVLEVAAPATPTVPAAAPTLPSDPQPEALIAAGSQALPEPSPSVVPADVPPAMVELTLDSVEVILPAAEASVALPARTSVASLLAVAATGPADRLFAFPAAEASKHTGIADDGLAAKPVQRGLRLGEFRLAEGAFGRTNRLRDASTAAPVGTEAAAVARKAIRQGKAQGLGVDLLDESEILDVLALPSLHSIAVRR
jgi:hypothetical protein